MVKNLIAQNTAREFRAAHAALTPSMGASTTTEFAAAQWGMLPLESFTTPSTVGHSQRRGPANEALGHLTVAA